MGTSVTAMGTLALALAVSSCGGRGPQPEIGTPRDRGHQPVKSKANTDGDFISLPIKPGEPCYQARKASLEEVAAAADVPVWMPHSPLASPETLTGAWTCGGDTPVLTFGQVTVSYESGYGAPLPWERKAKDSHGYVATILGRDSLVDPAEPGQPNGEVMVVVDDGVLIRVVADSTVATDDLVAVADSIRLDSPVAP